MPNAKSQRLLYSALVSSHRRRRQPIHTVYGGAHLFKADTAARLGTTALRVMQEYAPDSAALAAVLGLTPEIAARVHARVIEKLRREPVEDFRLDFEDGYGNRPDDEEDGHAESAAVGGATAAHFGTYDYTASRGITASHQHLRHPACDFARSVMQVALAGTDISLSDGATNVLPIGGDRAPIHRAWRLHYDDIRHSLTNAFYQGWDFHPAQLVTRYAAIYAFFLESLDAASARLRNFIAKAAQATLVGEAFDDAATGQGLLNFFLPALDRGAVRDEEIGSSTGRTLHELPSGPSG